MAASSGCSVVGALASPVSGRRSPRRECEHQPPRRTSYCLPVENVFPSHACNKSAQRFRPNSSYMPKGWGAWSRSHQIRIRPQP